MNLNDMKWEKKKIIMRNFVSYIGGNVDGENKKL
jgi:hypothetical protein